MVGIGFLCLQLEQTLAYACEIQSRLPKSCSDQCGLVIARNQEVEDAIVGIDRLFDPGHIFGSLGWAKGKERPQIDARARDPDIAHFGVGDRQDLPGIHARDCHQRSCQAVNLIEGLDGEDVTVLHLDDDDQDIGRAEHASVFFGQLQIGMAGWIKIEKVHLDRSMGQLGSEEERDHQC